MATYRIDYRITDGPADLIGQRDSVYVTAPDAKSARAADLSAANRAAARKATADLAKTGVTARPVAVLCVG